MAEALSSHVKNSRTDSMLRSGDAEGKIKIVYGDRARDEAFLRHSTVLPLYGDYNCLPPAFLSASDTEALADDSIML